MHMMTYLPQARLLLGAGAILLAWQAQKLLAGPDLLTGVLLYALALFLFLLGFAGIPAPRFAGSRLSAPPTAPRSTNRLALGLFWLSLLSTLAGVIQFALPNNNGTGWLLHICALLFFLAATICMIVNNAIFTPNRMMMSRISPLFLLGTVLALALFARLWQIDRFPFGVWYDEAQDGLAAIRILQDSSYRPVYVSDLQMAGHFDYLVALAFKLFGISILSVRLVTIAFGLLTVVFGYLLFRRWFGTRMGLVAAVLFAVMRYDLTFSRIALHGMLVPPFELAVLYFLDRALANKRRSDFALVGLMLGLGLNFYFAFRLFPFVPVAFGGGMLGYVLIRHLAQRTQIDVRARLDSFKLYLPQIALLLFGFVTGIAPFGQYAFTHSDEFSSRVSYVSIFEKRDEPDLTQALWSNFTKHLLMFNVAGDRNGRHNLPGAPMLDPLMGALCVLGFGYALWRWRDPANLLMLLLFFIMLMGGVLSVDFEAPQALRSIGVIPALVYFAVLPLAAIGVVVTRLPRMRFSLPVPVYSPALLLMLLVITAYNFEIFFDQQENSPDVWAAHSTPETVAAYEMKRLASQYDLVVTSAYAGNPVIRFLAPEVNNYRVWTASDHMPLERTSARGIAIILDPVLSAGFDEARRLYPTAQFYALKSPQSDMPVFYEARIEPKDMDAVQGVVAGYYQAESTPVKEEILPAINVDWTQSQPLPGNFMAEFRATLYVAQYGSYSFSDHGNADPDFSLLIDGNLVDTSPVMLAKGNHSLQLRMPSSKSKFELYWQGPGMGQAQVIPASAVFHPTIANSGLLGTYYRSPDWTGTPAFMQIDPEIEFYFQNLPLPRPYSVEWKGKIYAPTTGSYKFATESADDSHLFIDNQAVVENTRRNTLTENAIELSQGWHDLDLRYADKTAYTHIYLYWTLPGSQREKIPSRYLSPPVGRYPDGQAITQMPALAPVQTQIIDLQPPQEAQATTQTQQLNEKQISTAAPTNLPPALPVTKFDLKQTLTIGTGKPGNSSNDFDEPRAVAIGQDGTIYVADTGNKRVQVFDAAGHYLSTITGGAGSDEKFVEPLALAITSEGELVVLDSEPGWIYRFSPDGTLRARVGGPSAQLYHPRGMAIDGQNNLYIADTGGARVVKMSLGGEKLQVIGTRGNGNGQFLEPSDCVVDSEGYLFVTDVPNHRIEMFDAAGNYLREFQIPAANAYNGPHLTLAPDRSLLVTAPDQHQIQRYSREGALLSVWGDSGDAAGKLRLLVGIASDGKSIWVTDPGNHTVQKWDMK